MRQPGCVLSNKNLNRLNLVSLSGSDAQIMIIVLDQWRYYIRQSFDKSDTPQQKLIS